MLEKLGLENFQVSGSWLQALVLSTIIKTKSVTNKRKGVLLV